MPLLSSLDKRLLACIGEQDTVPILGLLNSVANEQAPTNRGEERTLLLLAWDRLRLLLQLGLVLFTIRLADIFKMPNGPRTPE